MPLEDGRRRTQIDILSLRTPYSASHESLHDVGSEDFGNVHKLQKAQEATPEEDTKRVNKKRRIAATEPDEDDPRSGPRPLRLVKAAESGVRAHQVVLEKRHSPWEDYEEVFQIMLDGFNTVAVRKTLPCDLVIVKRATRPMPSRQADILQKIQHRNFIALIDRYIFEENSYVVLEYVGMSLAHIVDCPAYLTELELAAILGQLVNALSYLVSKGLQLGSLKCSTVLLNPEGTIKITGQESCHEINSSNSDENEDIAALGVIAMKLMQKYSNDDQVKGIEDLDHWAADSRAVAFLKKTGSTIGVEKLSKDPLLLLPWRKEDLKWLAELGSFSACRLYKYHK